MCTMQAPHSPVPQPNLVPVSLRPSRTTQSSGVSGGASTDTALPFTVKFVAIVFLPASVRSPSAADRFCEVDVRAVATAGSCRQPAPDAPVLFGIGLILHRGSQRVEMH